MKSPLIAGLLLMCLSANGCQSPGGGRVAAADAVFFDRISWTAEDLAKPIAVRQLRRNSYVSHAVVRLAGPEHPHVHDQTELTVFIMSGRARMHMADQVHEIGPGDVIQIPHGMVHWAKPIDGPVEAYVVGTPPYDGKDSRQVEP